jgi:hypothetical protein
MLNGPDGVWTIKAADSPDNIGKIVGASNLADGVCRMSAQTCGQRFAFRPCLELSRRRLENLPNEAESLHLPAKHS